MSFALRTPLAAIAFVGLASPAFAAEITVQHAQGETTLEQNPKTVISFDLASLDTLDELGIKVAGIPGSNLPGYLEKYAGDEYLKVGSLFEPDYEAVAAAAPDLIIVAGRSSGAYEELSKIAPTIDLTNDWVGFEASVKQNARVLGEIFEKSAEVETMIDDLDARIAEVKTVAADAGTGLIVLTSAGEVTAYGPGSRFGWIHDSLGVVPAVADVEAATHGDAVSFEFILEADPDWLFVLDRDAAVGAGSALAVLDNQLVNETKAAKEGHIVEIDPVRAYIVNGGLTAFRVLVEQVGTALGA